MGVSSVKELERQTANLKRRLHDAEAEVERVELTAAEVIANLIARLTEARERVVAAEAALEAFT